MMLDGMTVADFHIGLEFTCGGRVFRCTDVGTRTIAAILLDQVEVAGDAPRILTRSEADAEGWFNGPPYAVAETVFDEYDMVGCAPAVSTHP